MSNAPLDLEPIIGGIRAQFDAQHAAREGALTACRGIIQHAALCIRATHRQEFAAAAALLLTARTQALAVQDALAAMPALRHAGFIHDAVKEYAEARLTLAMVRDEPLPGVADVGVDGAAYLHGLAEAAGELRRYALDALRRRDYPTAERLLAAMDEIYVALVTIDYPDAITYGLRRVTDMVRGVTEKTRGDLTLISMQQRLEERLRAVEAALAAQRAPDP